MKKILSICVIGMSLFMFSCGEGSGEIDTNKETTEKVYDSNSISEAEKAELEARRKEIEDKKKRPRIEIKYDKDRPWVDNWGHRDRGLEVDLFEDGTAEFRIGYIALQSFAAPGEEVQ